MHDHKAQEFSFTDLESTFFWVEAHIIFVELSEHLFQVYHMLGNALRFNDHVVNIDSGMLFENSIHQSLVCSACNLEADGHDPIAKVGIFSDKCCFLLVWSVHPDLVVSRIGILEA